ncbi:hypothetical protein K440DRAFT_619478 [Wilcoxina mikolae CBS 423.85]|nr:hypothetical protein K440DRAFT_619478 [Wilcoxina mikolae CBS 423.85]
MAPLTSLPPEILALISSYLVVPRDFIAFTRVCRVFQAIAVATLPQALVNLARRYHGDEPTAIMFTMRRFAPGRIWHANKHRYTTPKSSDNAEELIFKVVAAQVTAAGMIEFLNKAPRCYHCLERLDVAPKTVLTAADVSSECLYDKNIW